MPRPDIQDVVDSLGFGRAQLQALFLGGGTYAADGAELLLIGAVTKAVSSEWDLQAIERGVIVSVVFIGTLLGNVFSGFMGDMYGRRLPILISELGVCIFSIASAFSWDVWSLSFSRLLVGFAFGIGVPAWNALGGEISPSTMRILMNGLSQMLFTLGEIYSGALIYMQDPHMRDLHWRSLLLIGAIPAGVLFVLSLYGLKESPRHLAATDRYSEAKDVLVEIARQNGRDVGNIDFEPVPVCALQVSPWSSALQKMGAVLDSRLLYSTFVLCFSTFTLNFLFYGGLYAFPQVLPDLELHVAPAVNLMVGAVFEIPGYLLCMCLGTRMKRKSVLYLYLVGACLSTVLFIQGANLMDPNRVQPSVEVMCQFGFTGNKIFTSMGFLVVYLYSIEIYPTTARATGTALCIACGRVGSILCPLIYEEIVAVTGGYSGFFWFMACSCALNVVLVFFLPFETAGAKLPDKLDETQPLSMH